MKECLHCKKEFEPKKPTRKFCSDSCRVMHHRKNGKQSEVKPYQMKVLYDAIMDKLDKMVLPPIYSPITDKKTTFEGLAPIMKEKPLLKPKSVEEWIKEKREIELPELYEEFIDRLNADTTLTTKQKSIIKYT